MTLGFYPQSQAAKHIPDILLSPQQRWMSVGALSKCMTWVAEPLSQSCVMAWSFVSTSEPWLPGQRFDLRLRLPKWGCMMYVSISKRVMMQGIKETTVYKVRIEENTFYVLHKYHISYIYYKNINNYMNTIKFALLPHVQACHPKTGHTWLTFLAQLGIPAPHVANLSAYACKPWVPATDRMNLAREVIPQKSLTYCTWKTLPGSCSKLPFKRFEIYLTFKLVTNKMYSSTKCCTKRIDLWIACPGSNLTLSYFQWIAIQISARCKICQVTMGRPLVFRALVQGFVKSSTYHSILWWICRHHKLIFSAAWKVAKRTGQIIAVFSAISEYPSKSLLQWVPILAISLTSS